MIGVGDATGWKTSLRPLGVMTSTCFPSCSGAPNRVTGSAAAWLFDEPCEACQDRNDVAISGDGMQPQAAIHVSAATGPPVAVGRPENFGVGRSARRPGIPGDRKQSFSHGPGRWPTHGDAFEHGVVGRRSISGQGRHRGNVRHDLNLFVGQPREGEDNETSSQLSKVP